MEFGFDPEVTKYFRKIISTFSFGFLWLFANITAGMYYKLAFINGKLSVINIVFYLLSIISLAALLWFYYRIWKK
jgi:hypothetical protein